MRASSLYERLHPGGAGSSSSKLVFSTDELAKSCGDVVGAASLLPPPASPALPQSPSSPRPRARRHCASGEARQLHLRVHRMLVSLWAVGAASAM